MNDDRFYRWEASLWAGWRDGEPMATYLAAEYCRLAGEIESVSLSEYWPEALADGPNCAERLYLEAAERGCDLARLWLAYCYEEGRWGFAKRPEAAARLLPEVSGPLETVEVPGLSFLYEALEELYDAAERALYEWTDHGGEPQPDPDFPHLNERSMLLYKTMVALGLRDAPRHVPKGPLDYYSVEHDWDPSYDKLNALSTLQKDDWARWCRQKGFLADD